MAEQSTIEVPELTDIGLTQEGEETLKLYLESFKEAYNKNILDLEIRVKNLE